MLCLTTFQFSINKCKKPNSSIKNNTNMGQNNPSSKVGKANPILNWTETGSNFDPEILSISFQHFN